jgi:mannobiose 2-epimerase
MDTKQLLCFYSDIQDNLYHNILPFWERYSRDTNGGFYGRVLCDGSPVAGASKGFSLNARILWAFSNIYSHTQKEIHADMAKRAFDYICRYFIDHESGGAYSLLNSTGSPLSASKSTYCQAFLIYGMSEYYRVFQSDTALRLAMDTFVLLQNNLLSPSGGYYEEADREWGLYPEFVDHLLHEDCTVTVLGTNLHILEAFTSLYKISGNSRVKAALHTQTEWIMTSCYEADTHHMKAGMNLKGERTDGEESFGHDSECAYLLIEAADALGDFLSAEKAREMEYQIICRLLTEGIDSGNYGVYYAKDKYSKRITGEKIWWTQAEALTACLDAYQNSNDIRFLTAAFNIWQHIRAYLVDHLYGEWHSIDNLDILQNTDYLKSVNLDWLCGNAKISEVKAPYHNTRMCFSVLERLVDIIDSHNYYLK